PDSLSPVGEVGSQLVAKKSRQLVAKEKPGHGAPAGVDGCPLQSPEPSMRGPTVLQGELLIASVYWPTVGQTLLQGHGCAALPFAFSRPQIRYHDTVPIESADAIPSPRTRPRP